MADFDYRNALKMEGFRVIGSIEDGLPVTVWWREEQRFELAVIQVRNCFLLRATKHYRLAAMGKDGETYARDLGQLQSYLTGSFTQMHISMSAFRDITPSLAAKRVREKNFRHIADNEHQDGNDMKNDLQRTAGEIGFLKSVLQRDVGFLKLNHGEPGLLRERLPDQITMNRRRIAQLEEREKALTQQVAMQSQLEHEYLRKAEGVCIMFTVCSDIQIARGPAEFTDALFYVVKEINDIHRYQIRQKLGGTLRVYAEEYDSPMISLLTSWTAALPNPRQLAALGPDFEELAKAIEEQLMVLPTQDISVGGSTKDEKKLVGARVFRDFLKMLERVPAVSTRTIESPKSRMPVYVGIASGGSDRLAAPWELPIDKTCSIIVTGRTGSGKSFLSRTIVEGCTVYKDLAIIIFDPRNQWVGLLCPQDGPEILSKYAEFGFEPSHARSFKFTYHGLGYKLGEPLPEDLRQLARGRHIISFDGLDASSRCVQFANILNALFDLYSRSESDAPRVLIVVEESVRFTRKGVEKETQPAAQMAEQSLEQVAREGRKAGMILLLCTQRAGDYSHGTIGIRQNITTRIFMQNSDTDVENAQDWLPDSREIVRLRRGEALVSNPEWGTVRISVRPPLSKVWQFAPEETRKLVDSVFQNSAGLSSDARAVLDAARRLKGLIGAQPRLSTVAEHLGITSRRRLDGIVQELQKASAAKFQRLKERGKPLVIEPLDG